MIDFSDIRGHEEPVLILKKQVRSPSGAHALLLEGPSGIGKRLTALTAAAMHLCDEPGEHGPCGECVSCREMTTGSHFGLWLIDPEMSRGDRDADDPEPVAGLLPRLFEDSSTSGKIGIDPIRSLRDELNLKPSGDPRRGIVLVDFDRATSEAQNALLKTLEEPPDETLILCTVSSREGIPETVTSRCQRLRFKPLSGDQVIDILNEQTDLEPERARFLAAISEGRPGLALRFANGGLLETRNWFLDQVKQYGGAKDPRFRQAMEDRISDADDRRSAFEDLVMLHRAFLQDALYVHLDFADEAHLHFPVEAVNEYTEQRSLDQIMDAAERLEDLDTARELYVNEKVLIENLPS